MGILWAHAASPLQESLLQNTRVEQTLCRSGDILLVSDEPCDESAFGGGENWVDVSIIVMKTGSMYAFNGEYTPFRQYVGKYRRVCIRPLHCVRYSHFDETLFQAVNRTRVILKRAGVVKHKGPFAVARVMHIVQLLEDDALNIKWSVKHFSSNYTRRSLAFYGPNKEL